MREIRSGYSRFAPIGALLGMMFAAPSAQTPLAQTPPPGQTPPSAQTPPPGPPPPGQTAPPGVSAQALRERDHWKPEKLTNLKVLPKSTTPDQIMKIMTHFRLSLGMGCLGCHKGKDGQPLSTYDFADDSKENKQLAREMIKLTDDINSKYPDAFPARDDADKDKPKVTCATCHRRNRHPEIEPPPMPPRPEGAPQGPPGATPLPGQAPTAPRPPAGPPR